jgi:uncharacterized membrane protein (DUF106 family)
MSFLDVIFDPWLGKLLVLPPVWSILIISAFISLFITVVYKYTTNQHEMKRMKDDLKKYQKEMRETKDPKKLMAIQKKSLDINMKYMMASFKSTLYTFIPIIIIFAWLNAHIAYYPLMPSEDFKVKALFAEGARGNITLTAEGLTLKNGETQEIADKQAEWILSGPEGTYKLDFDYNTESYNKDVLITTKSTYEVPEKKITDSKLKMIVIGNKRVQPFGEDFNLFGWHPGWLATYIIFSLVFSTLFRKLFKVY